MLIFFLGSVVIGSAQNSVSAKVYANDAIEKALIKSYDYPATISAVFYPYHGSTCFVHLDSSMVSTSVALPGCRVNDFIVDSDSVFFCGESVADASKGVIGWFSIHDLFFGPEYFYHQIGFDFTEYLGNYIYSYYQVKKFHKMETFKDAAGSRHIVCVGEAEDTMHVLSFGCLVELVSGSSGEYIGFNVGYNTKGHPSSMLDVKKVGSHLVVVGLDPDRGPLVRLFDCPSIFSPTGPQDNLYVFGDFSNYTDILYPVNWNKDNILLAPRGNDLFSTATAWYSNYYSSRTEMCLNINSYDINLMLSGVNTSMFQSAKLTIPDCPNLDSVLQFINNSRSNSFGVLLNGKSVAESAKKSFMYEVGRNLNQVWPILKSTTDIDYCADYGLQGLDLFNGNTQYVMSGRCIDSYTIRTYQVETSGMPSNCFPVSEAELVERPNILSFIESSPLTTEGFRSFPTRSRLGTLRLEIDKVCGE